MDGTSTPAGASASRRLQSWMRFVGGLYVLMGIFPGSRCISSSPARA